MRIIPDLIKPFKLFIPFILLLLPALLNAQKPEQFLTTKNKKAEKLFYESYEAYNARDMERSLNLLEKAIHADPAFTEAYILKGDIKSDLLLFQEAVIAYRHAIETSPDFSPNLYYMIASLELKTGQYASARQSFLKFLTYETIPSVKKDKASNGIVACDYGIQAMKNPVPFNPVNLGDSINTLNDEYINALSSDDLKIYFTRKEARFKDITTHSQSYEEDFYHSDRILDSLWKKALNLGPPINTRGNEGALTISPDGQFLFFAACNRPDGFGSCDIYWSKKSGNQWTTPENLGEQVNSTAWDSQPSFSSDGKTLYFASKRPGGKGSSDIWKTVLLESGQWSPPENLGDSINSQTEEQTPFIHPDDHTLYFASRGFQGMGGLDLFYSRKNPEGQWGKAMNLGYPINTYADELTLVVNASGRTAYISSDKLGGRGKQDIYCFDLYPEARPNPVTYLKGIVYHKETKQRLEAGFELIDLKDGKTIVNATSDPVSGEFLLILPVDREYALNVSKPGYLFYSDHFSLTTGNTVLKPFEKNIPLQEIRIGETVVLKNIFFDTDQFILKDESKAELQRLIELLRKNPGMMIEISGHTDNVGTPQHNLELSLNRAKSVFDYLVNNGIGKTRLTYIGYGLSKPVDNNETEQGRANNRRTEFKITGNK